MDAESLPFEAVRDHIVLRMDGGKRGLLDTGSQISFGRGPFTLLGERIEPLAGIGNVDLDKIGRLVGVELDCLIGTDVLSRKCFLLEWEGRKVTFSSEPPDVNGSRVAVSSLMGCPVVEFEVQGRTAHGFLDTGATMSYLGDGPRPAPIGRRRDFHPTLHGFEEFEVETFQLQIVLGGRALDVTFGEPPAALRTLLRMAGVPWILGSDVWKKWDVLFDLPNGSVTLIERPM